MIVANRSLDAVTRVDLWFRDIDGLRPAEYERVDGEDVGVAPARQEPGEHCES